MTQLPTEGPVTVKAIFSFYDARPVHLDAALAAAAATIGPRQSATSKTHSSWLMNWD